MKDNYICIITPNVDEPVYYITEPITLEKKQKYVGGWIEGVPIPGRPDLYAFVNEEGKLMDLPKNTHATMLMQKHSAIFPGDYIAGTMLIVGNDPNTGEDDIALPADIYEWVTRV